MKQSLLGILLTLSIASCAKLLSLTISGISGVSLAIILGMLVGNIFKIPEQYNSGIQFSEKKLLTYAIILMGFKLQLLELGNMGSTVFLIILPVMLVTISSALLFGRLLGFSKSFSLLMGTGNAVCGSSAIAAVAPVTTANEEEIGISIGIVNLLGTVGMLILPLLASLIDFTDLQSSYLLGGVLQAIGQVVAAGFSMGDNIGESATLIKMLRVIMIGPIVMLVTICNKTQTQGKAKRRYIPNYIIGFLICSLIGSIFHSEQLIIPNLKLLANLLLMIAMAGIGLKIQLKSLIHHGLKSLLLGLLTTSTQTALILILIALFLR